MDFKTEFGGLLDNLVVSVKPQADPYTIALIADFQIEVDSVVATALVFTDNQMKRITIDWGDGTTDTLKSQPGVLINPLAGEPDPLPAGEYHLSHAYEVSDDRRPFDHIVLLRLDDLDGGVDFRIRQITLVPRYRIINYRTTVRLLSPCDPGGSTSEFDIDQLVNGQLANRWHWEPSNNFFGESQRFRLEGSAVIRELTVDDGYVDIRMHLTETDFGPDTHFFVSQGMNALQDSESVERTVEDNGLFSSCKVLVRYDREVSLIVPLPSGGPVFA